MIHKRDKAEYRKPDGMNIDSLFRTLKLINTLYLTDETIVQ